MKGQAALFTAVGIGVTLLCLLGVTWLGPLGAILNLLTPVPAVYLSMRFGLRAGVIVVAVVSLLLLQLAPVYTLATYLGVFGVGSLLLPFLLRQGQSWDKALLVSVSGVALVTATMMLIVVVNNGVHLEQLIDQLIKAEVDQAMEIYRQSGFEGTQLEELGQVLDGIADFVRQSFYGLYLAGVLAVQLLSLLFLQRFKRDHYQIAGAEFSRWRLPALLIWGLIVAGFAVFIPQPQVALIGRNLLAVLLLLYFLQGMAVVNSFLLRKAYPPLLKGLIYVMLVILNPLPLIITGVGVFDLWVDFRRPGIKKFRTRSNGGYS